MLIKVMGNKLRSEESITHGDFRYFKSSMSTSVVDPGTLKKISNTQKYLQHVFFVLREKFVS